MTTKYYKLIDSTEQFIRPDDNIAPFMQMIIASEALSQIASDLMFLSLVKYNQERINELLGLKRDYGFTFKNPLSIKSQKKPIKITDVDFEKVEIAAMIEEDWLDRLCPKCKEKVPHSYCGINDRDGKSFRVEKCFNCGNYNEILITKCIIKPLEKINDNGSS